MTISGARSTPRSCRGDTWHATIDDAREQAEFEYDEALEPWIDVPDDVEDAHAYAIQYAFGRLNR